VNEAGQTVCLCMIVKDEAPVIARCLASVRPFVDAWAIVDTGSTDETRSIVRECLADLPGELIDRPWVDFAHNRTEALALARGRADYVLVIDADEALEADAGFRLPRLEADAYDLEVSYDGLVYQRRQLLRDVLPWAFRGVLHEYVHSDAARTVGRLEGLRTIVRHDGARSRDPLTYRRDALALEQGLLDEPDNARYAFYLGQSYRDAGELEAAIRAYRRRLEMGGWPDEIWYSAYQIALLRERLEHPWPEVLEAFLAAFATGPDRAEPLFRIGLHYQRTGEHHLAHLFFSRAMAVPPPGPDRLFVERSLSAYVLPVEHAVAAHYAGALVEAVETNTALLRGGHVPPEMVSQIVRNRRFSLDLLHPADPGPPPRLHVAVLAGDPAGSGLELAVDSALRQEDASGDVVVLGDAALAARLPEDPRLCVLPGTDLAAFARSCGPDDVIVPLPAGSSLASRHTLAAVAGAFADRGCRLLHGAHRSLHGRGDPVDPPATAAAFAATAARLDGDTALCLRAGLLADTGAGDAATLWAAAGFAGTRSLDGDLTVAVAPPPARRPIPAATDATAPSVSCLMITRDRLPLARLAIRCFADQTHPRRELVIVSEGDRWYRRALQRCLDELEVEHARIVPADPSETLGGLRNLSMDAAGGDIVCQWDDDDLSHPDRLETQLGGMLREEARCCFLTDHIQYLERERRAFWIDWTMGGRLTDEQQLFPGTVMLYKDPAFRYPDSGPLARRGEDSVLVRHLFETQRVARLPGMGHLYLYRYHGANTFDEAHHRRISSCCAPVEAIAPLAERIRAALAYYPIPKPVVVFGAEGPALAVA